MSTAYQDEIDSAYADILAAGTAGTLYRAPASEAAYDPSVGDHVVGTVKVTEAEVTSLAADADSRTFTAGSGDLAALGFAAGQIVKLRGAPVANDGPFTVASVSGVSLVVSEVIADMAALSSFTLYATSEGPSAETVRIVHVGLGGGYGLALRTLAMTEGLAIYEHDGFILAAKGLSADPTVGDRFTFGGRTYTISALSFIAPDGTPILWNVLGKRA